MRLGIPPSSPSARFSAEICRRQELAASRLIRPREPGRRASDFAGAADGLRFRLRWTVEHATSHPSRSTAASRAGSRNHVGRSSYARYSLKTR